MVGAGEDIDGAFVVAENVHLGRLPVSKQAGEDDLGMQNVSHDSVLAQGQLQNLLQWVGVVRAFALEHLLLQPQVHTLALDQCFSCNKQRNVNTKMLEYASKIFVGENSTGT